MIRYFKHNRNCIFYSFDFSKHVVKKYSYFYSLVEEPTVFGFEVLTKPWFISGYIEISEIEFNSIFEL